MFRAAHCCPLTSAAESSTPHGSTPHSASARPPAAPQPSSSQPHPGGHSSASPQQALTCNRASQNPSLLRPNPTASKTGLPTATAAAPPPPALTSQWEPSSQQSSASPAPTHGSSWQTSLPHSKSSSPHGSAGDGSGGAAQPCLDVAFPKALLQALLE